MGSSRLAFQGLSQSPDPSCPQVRLPLPGLASSRGRGWGLMKSSSVPQIPLFAKANLENVSIVCTKDGD